MAYGQMTDEPMKKKMPMKAASPTAPMKKKTMKKKMPKKSGELTKAQLKKLANHKQHTKKHLDTMRQMMLDGKSFDAAHLATVKMVGN